MNVNPDSQPDYFSITYSANHWHQTLLTMEKAVPAQVLCLSEQGISTAKKVYAFWQKIKGLLGLTNHCHEIQVNAQILKFLFYGATQGYHEKKENIELIHNIQRKIARNELRVDAAVQQAFQSIGRTSLKSKIVIQDLRENLCDYYQRNKSKIQPPLWSRLFAKKINTTLDQKFGETYLALAGKILAQEVMKKEDIEKNLNYYTLAAQRYNSMDKNYTGKLSTFFQSFLSRCYNTLQYNTQYNPQIGQIDLLLATRYLKVKNYRQALTYFKYANDLIKLEKVEIVHMLSCANQMKDIGTLQSIVDRLDANELKPKHKIIYAKALELLGDHFKEEQDKVIKSYKDAWLKIFKAKPTYDYGLKALNCYRKVVAFANNSEKSRGVFEKIKSLIVQSRDHWLKNETQTVKVGNNAWDFLISMLVDYSNISDLYYQEQGRQLFTKLVNALHVLYLNLEDKEMCLPLLDITLEHVDSIQKLIYSEQIECTCPAQIYCDCEAKEGWQDIQSSVRGLVKCLINDEGKFNYDMGASLHFLRGEILRGMKEPPLQKMLEDFEMAEKLAPKHPFGAWGLFAIDEQQTPIKPENMLVWSESVRKSALRMGAAHPSLKIPIPSH